MPIRLPFPALAVTLASTLPAAAAPILAGYPAPGGTSYSASGSALHATAFWVYSGFDTSAWDMLWWGPELIELAMDGAIDEPGETLSLSFVSGATAIWTGLTSLAAGNVETRLIASIVSGGSDWIDPITVDILTGIEAVSEVDGTEDFVIEAAIQARFAGGTAWQPFLPFFDQNSGLGEDGNARTSYYRNFYYTAAVPLPAGLPLIFTGLAALGATRLYRRS